MRREASEEPRESTLASGWTIEGESAAAAVAGPSPDASAGGDTVEDADLEDTDLEGDGPAQLSNLALVVLGVLGGLYLLYAWIWLSWAQYYAAMSERSAEGAGAIGAALQQLVFWAAPLAPVLWFLSALLLNRDRFGRLLLWILIGAIVLLPLPLFSGAFAGGGS